MGRFYKEVILKGPKGEKEVDLLVDTGAKFSTIDKKISDELGFIKIGPSTIYGIDKKPVEGDTVVANINIDNCSSPLFIASAKDMENVLGADVMQQLDAKVEPKIHKITVRKCEPYINKIPSVTGELHVDEEKYNIWKKQQNTLNI